MAFDVKASIEAIHGYLTASGYPGRVQVGEPKQPPSEQIMAAVYMRSSTITRVYLGGDTGELHIVSIRLHMNMLHEPTEDIEYRLALAVSQISSDLLGDYELGGTIREIDAAGMNGTPMSATWGYVSISDLMYRTVEITVPMNVDGSATAAP